MRLASRRFHHLSRTGTTVSFYPASGLFLNDNLFPVRRTGSTRRPIGINLNASINTNADFSLLRATGRTCGITRLQNRGLSTFETLFLTALNNTETLYLRSGLNDFRPNGRTSYVILGPETAPLLTLHGRTSLARTLRDMTSRLFSLLVLNDSHTVATACVVNRLTCKAT